MRIFTRDGKGNIANIQDVLKTTEFAYLLEDTAFKALMDEASIESVRGLTRALSPKERMIYGIVGVLHKLSPQDESFKTTDHFELKSTAVGDKIKYSIAAKTDYGAAAMKKLMRDSEISVAQITKDKSEAEPREIPSGWDIEEREKHFIGNKRTFWNAGIQALKEPRVRYEEQRKATSLAA